MKIWDLLKREFLNFSFFICLRFSLSESYSSNIGIKTQDIDLNYSLDIKGDTNISGDLFINKQNLTKTLITKPTYLVWDSLDVLENDNISISINGSNIKVKTKSYNPYQDGIANADDFSTFSSIAYLLQKNTCNINDAENAHIFVNDKQIGGADKNGNIQIDANTLLRLKLEDTGSDFIGEQNLIIRTNPAIGVIGNIYSSGDIIFNCICICFVH